MRLPTSLLTTLFSPNTEPTSAFSQLAGLPIPSQAAHACLLPWGLLQSPPRTATMASPNTQRSVLRVFPYHLPSAKLCEYSHGNTVWIPPKATVKQGFKCKQFILMCREYCERGGEKIQNRKAVTYGCVQGQLQGM